MNIFDIIITKPVLWIINICYTIVPNYVFALILFTIVVRIVLFPFSLWSQVQAVKMAKMKPFLDDIKAYHSDDWRLLLREQKMLYKKEHYSSFVSMLPLLLQIPIIIGVIRALDYANIMAQLPVTILIPLISGVSAFALSYVQNYYNVLAKEMGFFSKWGLAIFLTLFSFYFSLTSGVGFSVYWIAGNILAIFVQLLCNIIYNPKKYITYQILPKYKRDKAEIKLERKQEKFDGARFARTKKYLVFYSEKSGYYKYYRGIIEYILDHSKINVHYLTSDINDQVFNIEHPRFHAYYCGEKKLIVTFMKLDCRVAVLTLPDLQNYQYKRSIVNKRIEYIYTDHGFGSLMLYRKRSFDSYDTIFCFGPNYNQEILAMEKYYGSKPKNLVNTGYTLFNDLVKNYKKMANSEKIAIVAPSWQKDNILENCIDDLTRELYKCGYKVIVRPHPEYIKKFPRKIENLKQKYKDELQLDFSVNVMNADLLITDWSSIAMEYAYVTNKPVLYIETPMKVVNPEWDKYGLEPLEISIRNKIGYSIKPEEINNLAKVLLNLSKIEQPRKVINSLMYDNKIADEIAGEYIIKKVKQK